MTRWEERAKAQNEELARRRAQKQEEWRAQQQPEQEPAAAPPAAVAEEATAVVVDDTYVPAGYRGRAPEPDAEQGRFWFAIDGEDLWVDEFGQRWPASMPPVDSRVG